MPVRQAPVPRARVPEAAVPAAEPARAADAQQTLRVPAAKIDHLLDVAGEIMQDRRRMAHSLGQQAQLSPDIAEILAGSERMLDDLKDTAVGMRTLPLAVITGPLPRAVRDIAVAAGKDVDFVVTGTDTEIDRVILESLSEPLTHLLRNAAGHGIELPAERERAAKPARGRVELRALPRGSMVEIAVTDRLSRMTRSISVSVPVTAKSTSFPAATAMSRTARGSGPVITASGSVRIPTAVSLRSSSMRSPPARISAISGDSCACWPSE
jgi:two-component system chemotaxis sensor kinase CheA